MQTSFDHIAHDYDKSFTQSKTGQLQRKMVWQYLDAHLSDTKILDVLEMNCGTGEDAIYLAQKGHRLLATDISSSMVEVAKTKVKKHSLAEQVSLQTLGFEQLTYNKLQKQFDVVFSNFGGLNCVNPMTINEIALNASKLLKPGGRFIAVVMPESCMWEQFYFLLKLKWKSAFRRSKGTAMAHVDGKWVETWYYNPKLFKQLMGDRFRKVGLKPIGIALPPSYLEVFFKRKDFLLKGLNKMEKGLNKFSFLSRFSDHYLIDLQLKK